jgi:hypothetical protein
VNEIQVTLSYDAIESLAKGEPVEIEVDDLETRIVLTASPIAMRVLRAQIAAVRLLYVPIPKTEH